jgi:hypothetical protein
MLLLIAALVIAGAIVWSATLVARAIATAGEDRERSRQLQLLTLFAPAQAAATDNPRQLLAWAPVARLARELFPAECAALDRAAGTRFPIDREAAQTAHARWTSDWLAWERTHDTDYKLKALAAQEQADAPAVVRARLDAIEREKLDLYQRRYEEYVRIGKALQALTND